MNMLLTSLMSSIGEGAESPGTPQVPTKPVMVDRSVSADDANKLYGEAYGVDWTYGEEPPLESTQDSSLGSTDDSSHYTPVHEALAKVRELMQNLFGGVHDDIEAELAKAEAWIEQEF